MLTREKTLFVQRRLHELGYDPGPIDGDWGNRSAAALRQFQAVSGLVSDGKPGPLTMPKLMAATAVPASAFVRPTSNTVIPARAMAWPKESEVPRFFGPAGGPQCTAGKVRLPISFRLAWDLNTTISAFNCHEKVAPALTGIFGEAVEHYGEAEYRRLGLDLFGGCFNDRAMRGGTSKSMHAWGIACDLDPERNQLRWGRDRAVFARPEYLPFWQIVESYGAVSLGRTANYDWMHFQFARR